MLRAFFDESAHEDSGTFCLAGYVFRSREARTFNREWHRLFGGRLFHMKEYAHGRGAFADLSGEERDQLFKKAIGVITRTAAVGIIVYCDDVADIKTALHKFPVAVQGFNNPYALCHHNCMAAFGARSRQHYPRDGISYVFENTPQKHDAYEFMQDARKLPAFMDSYNCMAHTFAKKEGFLALQAADTLAWEWVKFRREAGKRPTRKTLQALVRGDLKHEILNVTVNDVADLSVYLNALVASMSQPPPVGPPSSAGGG